MGGKPLRLGFVHWPKRSFMGGLLLNRRSVGSCLRAGFLALIIGWAPAKPPVVTAPRRAATALFATTRREADSLRVVVGWNPDARPAPPVRLPVAALTATGAVRWRDTVTLHPLTGVAAGRTFTLPAARLDPTDRLRLTETTPAGDERTTDLPLANAALTRTYWLTDSVGQPLTRPWAHTGEALRAAYFGLEVPLILLRYRAGFQAALPPMAVGVALAAAPTINVIGQREVFPGDTFTLRAPGLYALRMGNTGPLDALLAEDGGFPEVHSAPDLIRPLLYLTTREERQKLYDAPYPKKATDRFWLDGAQENQEQARLLIRTYYGRVAEANRLYSCHKAGWMTDRGMLLVVFGSPPRVEPTPDGEDWVYRDVAEAGGARFRFRRRPAIFAPDQYELIRDRSHERVWYAATALWRKGTLVTAVR